MKNGVYLLGIMVFILVGCASRQQPLSTPYPVLPHEGILRVAYSKNADPWIWTEGVGTRQLADSVNVMEVIISSDGQLVAFKRDDTGEILAVNADGGNLHTIVDAQFLWSQKAQVWVFDFIPDTHDIVFTLKENGGSFRPFYDLYTADADSSAAAVLMIMPPGQGGISTFSPDGEWMTLYHQGGLDLARVDGTEGRSIFTYPEGYEPATFGPNVVWMQDSSGFVVYHIPDPVVDLARGELRFVSLEGKSERKYFIDNPWGIPSPDGQLVGYISTGTPGEVHIVDDDGMDQTYKTFPNAYFYGWAPDSRHFIIFIEEERDGHLLMVPYLCRLGAEPIRLVETGGITPLYWITESEFLFVRWSDLQLQQVGSAGVELDTGVYNVIDFTLMDE